MRLLIALGVLLSAIALSAPPIAILLDFHDPDKSLDDQLLHSGALAYRQRLEAAGYHVLYRHLPKLADLEKLRKDENPPKDTPVFLSGHGVILDPKTMNRRYDERGAVERNAADLKHFIVPQHQLTGTGLATEKILATLDPKGDQLRFVVNSCESGRVCQDCRACVGAACQKDEFTFQFPFDEPGLNHFGNGIVDLLSLPVADFLKYSDGKCEIGPAGLTDYFKDRQSFHEEIEGCKVYPLNGIGKGTQPSKNPKVAEEEKACDEAAAKGEAWAKAGKDRGFRRAKHYHYAFTYEGDDGQRHLATTTDGRFESLYGTSSDDFSKQLAYWGSGKGWQWPKDCGKDSNGKARKNCELYSESGKVVPIKIDNVLIRRQKRPSTAAPARVSLTSGNPAEVQTPCIGNLKLRHPKCEEADLKRHQAPASKDPH